MTGVRIAVVGKTAKLTGTVYVRDLKDKVLIRVRGIMDSKFRVSTFGPVEVPSKVNGKTAKDMALVLSLVGDGFTGVSGLKASKDDTAFDNLRLPTPNTKERGPMDYKMGMDQKPMLMAERSKDNG